MTTYEKEKRREGIIVSAAGVFADKGYAGTSMADIAKAAGIGKGTTYEYFKGKDDLFFAVFEWFVRQMEASANLTLDSLALKSASERLRAFSESILGSLKQSEELYPLVLEFWAASVASVYRDRIREVFKDIYKRFGAVLSDIIKEGMDTGEFAPGIDPDAVASATVGAWDAMGLQSWFNDDFDIDRTMTDFTALIIKGLLNKEAGSAPGQ